MTMSALSQGRADIFYHLDISGDKLIRKVPFCIVYAANIEWKRASGHSKT